MIIHKKIKNNSELLKFEFFEFEWLCNSFRLLSLKTFNSLVGILTLRFII